MMRQCWFIGKTDHYGDCDNGGGYARMAAETIWGFSVFPPQVCCKPKTPPNKKS